MDTKFNWHKLRAGERTYLYGAAGDGSALLFLHGWGLGYRAYRRSLQRLAECGARVVAPALPGFGGNPGLPGEDLSFSGYADWVDGFLDALGIEEPVAVSLWRVSGLARSADLTVELEQLRARGLPIVVLWGRADRVLPRASMESLCAAAGITPDQVVTVPGKHTWLLADPRAFGEVMTNVAALARLWPLEDDGRTAA